MTEKQPQSDGVRFAPRVEAEEGEPTRFDYVVLALVVAFIAVALLWALGIVRIPGVAI